jgi:hypothetical protein
LVRYFTVQAVQDTLLMKMNLANLHKMQKQFNVEFFNLFKESETVLNRALKQKLLATQNVDDYENRTVVSANKFYK